MGKNLQHQETGISMENKHPGCMWGILHVLHRQRWHHVRRKMIPYKRNAGGKNPSRQSGGQKQDNNGSSHCKISNVTEKGSEPNTATKSSMKSRIKGFISEEFCKRKGVHRRSSSYPTRIQLARTDSIHHLEPSRPLSEVASSDCTPWPSTQVENNNFCRLSFEPKTDKKQQIDSEIVSQDKLKRAKQMLLAYQLTNSKHSDQDFLEFFATDKELLRKVIEYPSSPLANFIHGRRAFKSNVRFKKSMSFPVPGFPARRYSTSSQMNQEPCNREDLSTSVKKRQENKVVVWRFKNLKKKIKHAIKESRKERQRITMDAVLHKIPYGRKSSKEAKEEAGAVKKEIAMKKSAESGGGSDQKMRRISSFDESLDRYRELYESCFNAEAKQQLSEGLKLRSEKEASTNNKPEAPKCLNRILSLPDLPSHYLLHIHESSTAVAAESSADVAVVGDETQDNNNNVELDQVLGKDEAVPRSFGDEEEEEEEVVVRVLKMEESNSQQENEIVVGVSPVVKLVEPSSSSLPDSSQTDIITEANSSLSEVDYGYLRSLNTNDAPEFGLVKYVLDLSGFSRNEALGTWHSPDQPLDPSLFEELQSTYAPEPECSGNEEKWYCNLLLLFDLINEVLLDVYEKSFTYYPKPLSPNSHIRPLPTGNHVLEEVWWNIDQYLNWIPQSDHSLDHAVSQDLAKGGDGWMDLQFEAECVSLELEEMIFDDLLDEFTWV